MPCRKSYPTSFTSVMAYNLEFVPGRSSGSENPILDGHRFILNRRKENSVYWKCAQFRYGCNARITTVDKQLTSPLPQHSHDPSHAENSVYIAKQILKRRAAETDLPTKYLAAESVAGMGFEARSKLGCQISGLSRMARRQRQATNNHPLDPRDLENLSIPSNYILSSNNDCLLLWDSGFSPQTRRSFLFGTATNSSSASDAEHFIMDGTFKSAPRLFTQLFTVHGLFPDQWHLPLFYGLLPGKTTTLYKNLLEELDSWGPFSPQSILLDYELAIHNAVAEVWPSVSSSILSRQTWWRNTLFQTLRFGNSTP